MATVQYDDILLNIGSRASTDGIEKSISMLKQLKEIFPIGGIKESADAMKEFASAINSMDKGVVTALASIKGNLTKVATAMKSAQKQVGKDNLVQTPFADKKPVIEVFDAAKARAEDLKKTMEDSAKAIELPKQKPQIQLVDTEQARLAKEIADAQARAKAETESFAKLQAQVEKSMASAEKTLARQATNEARARAQSAREAQAQALADVAASEARERLDASSAPRSDIADAVQREMARLRSGGGGHYVEPEEYWNPDRVAEDFQNATEELERINADIGDGADEAQRFEANVRQLVQDLANAPPTSNSFLRQQGYTTQEIVAAKQEIANMRWEERQAAQAAREAARATGEIGREANRARTAFERFGNRIGNFLQYRLMRAVFSGIVNGAKQGFTNLENWDRNIGKTGFAESMDKGRESLEALKNSLAVIAAPGLEFVIGLLEKIAKWAITAANTISRFFAILAGSDTYVAVEWPDYIAGTTDEFGRATTAAKDFKRQLMGFDEINNITEQKGGSGGSGSGKGGFKYKDMFSKQKVGDVSDFEKRLKKIWEILKKIVETVKEWFLADWDRLKAQWDAISEPLKKAYEWLQNLSKKILYSQKTMDQTATKFNIVGQIILQALVAPFKVFVALVKAAIKAVGALGEYIATTFQNVKDLLTGKINLKQFTENMKEAGDSLKKNMGDALDDLNKGLHKAFDTKWQLDVNGKLILNEVDVSGLGSSYFKITKYASGGYPNTGSLFIAGESGPEMVGTIGGSTAVANNDDIVAAVSQGVASAVASVLGGGTNVNVVLEGDAKNLFRVVQNQARNYAIQTGSYAFG